MREDVLWVLCLFAILMAGFVSCIYLINHKPADAKKDINYTLIQDYLNKTSNGRNSPLIRGWSGV